MPTLEENVNRVKAAKTAIGNAITAKGGTVGVNDGLEDFAADIASIQSGGVEISDTPNAFKLLTNIDQLNVIIPSNCTSIGDNAFDGCKGLLNIQIPNTITSVGVYAFRECSGIKQIDIPNSVTTIGNYAFERCANLEELKLSTNISRIGNYICHLCSKLKHIEIPSGVTDIGRNAFDGCAGLEYIKFKSLSPPVISQSNAFALIPTTCIIYVPTGTLSAYTSTANMPSSSTYTYVEY